MSDDLHSGRASNETLDSLHNIIARTLLNKIRSGEATAADINVARQFLKDNGIEQVALPGTPIRDLASTLPFAGTDSYPQ